MPPVLAFDAGFLGGVHVAVGAVIDPNAAVIVAGAGRGGAPHVRVFTAGGDPAGVELLAYEPAVAGGVRVAACDVDGDGKDEIVTAVGPGGGPHVRVWSVTGPAGGVVERLGFLAYDPGFAGGVFVACADLDGDGRAEIVTGADAGGGGHVRVFAVSGGAVVERAGLFPFDAGFTGGVRVAAGALGGAGTPGGPGSGRAVTAAGPGGAPHVRVLALIGGALVETAGFMAYDPGFTGGVHVGTGRVTGTAAAQIVTAPGTGGGPHVRVFDGAGTPLGDGFLAGDASLAGGLPVAGSR
jgi:hypothetical protein